MCIVSAFFHSLSQAPAGRHGPNHAILCRSSGAEKYVVCGVYYKHAAPLGLPDQRRSSLSNHFI